jgi:hypothetical protein
MLDSASLKSVNICHLPSEHSDSEDGGTSDYTGWHQDEALSIEELAMEAVRYVNGDWSSQSHNIVKATALAWCLDCKNAVVLSDQDPTLLTFAFPHQDPWGIGQYITFEWQVCNLLMQDDSPFQLISHMYAGTSCRRRKLIIIIVLGPLLPQLVDK